MGAEAGRGRSSNFIFGFANRVQRGLEWQYEMRVRDGARGQK